MTKSDSPAESSETAAKDSAEERIVEHLQVRSLSVVNKNGQAKICLDASGEQASIVMMSATGRTLQIVEQPAGHITISFDGPQFSGQVSLTPNGLTIRDAEGRLGVHIGDLMGEPGKPGVIIFKDGQPEVRLP